MHINWFNWIIFSMIIHVINKIGGNDNSPNSLNVTVNFHYYVESSVITWYLPSMSWCTACFMDISCWSSLASRIVVTLLRPAWNQCSVSWYPIAEVSLWLMISMVVFHKTSTRPTPLKLIPSPFGISTIVIHVPSYARVPLWNATCTKATTLSQWVLSVSTSRVDSLSHLWRCSARIPNGPPDQFRRINITALET